MSLCWGTRRVADKQLLSCYKTVTFSDSLRGWFLWLNITAAAGAGLIPISPAGIHCVAADHLCVCVCVYQSGRVEPWPSEKQSDDRQRIRRHIPAGWWWGFQIPLHLKPPLLHLLWGGSCQTIEPDDRADTHFSFHWLLGCVCGGRVC